MAQRIPSKWRKRWASGEAAIPRSTLSYQRRQEQQNQAAADVNLDHDSSPGSVRFSSEDGDSSDDSVNSFANRRGNDSSIDSSPSSHGTSRTSSESVDSWNHSDLDGQSEDHQSNHSGIEDQNPEDLGYEQFVNAANNFSDKYGLDDKAEFECKFTKFEILIMVLHYSIRYSLTDVAVEGLVTMLNSIMGAEVIPGSKYLFNQLFKARNQGSIMLYCPNCQHFLGEKKECNLNACPSCHEPINVISLSKKNYFIVFKMEDQIREKLESPDGEAMLTYRESRQWSEDTISDVFDGLNFQKLEAKVSGSYLTATFSTDGAQIFNSSTASSWAIQYYLNETPPKERFAAYNLLLAGIWHGKSSLSMLTYFKAFVEEAEKLATEGVRWFRKSTQTWENTRVYFTTSIIDTVAKAKVMYTKQFNGKSGCYICYHKGDQLHPTSNQYRYGHREEYELRTDDTMRREMRQAQESGLEVNGIKGISPLYFVPNFIFPLGVPIDFMHSHLLGVTKYMCEMWMNSKNNAEEYYLDGNKVNVINKRIKRLHPPSEISREPRPLTECAQWKANEWGSWLFFYGPACLLGILPEPYFRNFCLLSASIYFFNQSCIPRADIAIFGDYLSLFVRQFQELYGLEYMTFNMHLSEHIKVNVICNGPLWSHSAFVFESGCGYLGRLVKGPKGVQIQIARHWCMFANIPAVVALHPPLNEEVIKFCDEILEMRRFKKAEKVGDVTVIGNKQHIFVPSAEELAAIHEEAPLLVGEEQQLKKVKKILFNRSIYCPYSAIKEVLRNDSYALLSDGRFIRILALFAHSMHQVYIIAREVLLEERDTSGRLVRGQALFHLQNFHLKCCQPYFYSENLIVTPASQIREKCVFLNVEENDAFVSLLPNRAIRD